jgi:hypothetical protein
MDRRHPFVRHRRHRPWRLSPSVCALVDDPATLTLPPAQQRPARFVTGLDILEEHETLVPEEKCKHAPLDIAVYVGRAEEIAEDGRVTARLWELPGGQESIATLSPTQLDEQPVRPGASLRIWTWLELPDGASRREPGTDPVPEIYIEVRHRRLTVSERAEVDGLIATLTQARDGTSKEPS